jgi:hypothetical protein
MSTPMNDYDSRALKDILAWQGRKPSRRLRNAIPKSVRERAGELVDRGKEKAGETFDNVPGSEQVKQVLLMTLVGATRTIGAGAAASVSTSLVVRRYRKAGHSIERIEDIQDLELAASDRVFPRRKRLAYIVISGAEGGVAGAATTVSGAATVVTGVFGAGAGGVPTAIVTAGVMVGDIAATLMTASRIVAETSALYGYDPNDPAEQLFMTGVLGAATATSEGAKLAAQRELRELAKLLARRAPYRLLDKSVFTQVVRRAYAKLGDKMTQRQLGKVVPITSIAVGAGLNAALMHRTADEAYYAYRERRLQDRYDLDSSDRDHDASEIIVDAEVVDDSEEPLNIIGLLDEAQRESADVDD